MKNVNNSNSHCLVWEMGKGYRKGEKRLQIIVSFSDFTTVSISNQEAGSCDHNEGCEVFEVTQLFCLFL